MCRFPRDGGCPFQLVTRTVRSARVGSVDSGTHIGLSWLANIVVVTALEMSGSDARIEPVMESICERHIVLTLVVVRDDVPRTRYKRGHRCINI